jgi:hypothetical protein
VKHRRHPESGDAAADDRLSAASRATDAVADPEPSGRHGLHHDESIVTEHEPFSITSQRCRGEYP